MKLKTFAVIGLLPMLAACADMATGLAMYSDQLAMEQGSYWDDEHHSDSLTGDCPAFYEFGRVNNQTYFRVRNLADTDSSLTLTWSSGSESSFYLQPGETSDFVYMTPSVTPDHIAASC